MDADDPPADYNDNPGTLWLPGETFTDAGNQVSISVDYATLTGFVVTIGSGDTTGWLKEVP